MICPNCQNSTADDLKNCDQCGCLLSPNITAPPRDSHRQVKNFSVDCAEALTQASPGTPKFCRERNIPIRESLGVVKIHTAPEEDLTGIAPLSFEEPAAELHSQQNEVSNASHNDPGLDPIYGWLVVVNGDEQWRQFTIAAKEDPHVIGRAPDCQIRFCSSSVSERHASLRLKNVKLFITDLDSSTGTFVQDQEISRIALNDGDNIRVGDIIMKFRRF